MFSFVVFCLLQVMILNHIHLFGFITPLFYVYFLLSFEYNYPRWGILLLTRLPTHLVSQPPQ